MCIQVYTSIYKYTQYFTLYIQGYPCIYHFQPFHTMLLFMVVQDSGPAACYSLWQYKVLVLCLVWNILWISWPVILYTDILEVLAF